MSRIPSSRRQSILLFAVCLAGLWIAGSQVFGDDQPVRAKSVRAQVADLSWMSGCWRGMVGKDTVEESWGRPVHGSMTGTFRWIKADGVWMYELIAIRQVGDTIDYRFKHFDNELVGWEDNDKPLTFAIEELEERKVVFGSTGDTEPTLITYHRVSEDDMHIQVGPRDPGQGQTLSFKLNRVREGS